MEAIKNQKLSENLEDYLETISSLSEGKGSARPTDIADALSVKKPSVTAALNALAERGLVEYEKYRPVTLTKDGLALAQNVQRKHKLLSGFFTNVLGVNASEADIAACKMEHALDDSIMHKLVKFLNGLKALPTCSECKKCGASCNLAVPLSELKKGDSAIVLEVDKTIGNLAIYAGMGLTIGAKVKVLRVAPLGDPMIILSHGSEISMRKKQLSLVKVKPV